jgi:hypothetical protein
LQNLKKHTSFLLALLKNKSLLFSILLALSGRSVSAQAYHPLVQDSIFWNVNHFNGENPPINGHYQLAMAGDTLLEEVNYKKLYMISGDGWKIEGFIREENRRVYFRLPDNHSKDSAEMLLYDFNLLVGDTFKTVRKFNSLWGTIRYRITSIDSVILLNGQIRRRYNFIPIMTHEGLCQQTWIEGIGSLVSPDYILGRCDGFETFENLTCVFDKEKLIWNSSSSENCRKNIGISPVMPFRQLGIFPNPATEFLYIKNFSSDKPYSYSISGPLGQEESNGCLSALEQVIPIMYLPKGIHYLRIKFPDQEAVFYSVFVKD